MRLKLVFFFFWFFYTLLFSQSNTSRIKCGFAEQLKTGKRITSLYKATDFQKMYISPEGHFHIYYDTTGNNAIGTEDFNGNGIPDRVEIVAYYAEKDWRLIIDTLGFHPPYDYDGNFVEYYNVYFVNFGYNLYGQTLFDSDDIPSVPGNNMTSHIELNTTYPFAAHLSSDPFTRDSLAIAVTISHEFFHAIQLGYHIRLGSYNSQDNDLWWIEASATTFEEWNVPNANDYLQYLSDLYRYLNLPVYYQAGERIYGEMVLSLVMERYMGKIFMREVWENIIHQNAVQTISQVLQNHQLSWQHILSELGFWCLHGGMENDLLYPDFALWPRYEEIASLTKLNPDTLQSMVIPIEPYSVALQKIENFSQNQYLIQQQENANIFFYFWDGFGKVFMQNQTPIVLDVQGSKQIYMIIGAGDVEEGLSLKVTIQPFLLNDNFTGLLFPNPFKTKENKFLVIQGKENISSFEIFDIGGRKIYSFHPDFATSFLVIPVEQLSHISTGMYFYKIKTTKNHFGKMMIIK